MQQLKFLKNMCFSKSFHEFPPHYIEYIIEYVIPNLKVTFPNCNNNSFPENCSRIFRSSE